MTERRGIDPDELKASFARIEELARANAERSSQIRAGIKGFERRLQSLSGKVHARVVEKAADGQQIIVSFEQHGTDWHLVVAERRGGQGTASGVLMVDADVDMQIRAIRILPRLLVEMIVAHEQRAQNLGPALAMISELGIAAVALYEDDPKERAA